VDRLGHVKCIKFNTNFPTVYFRRFVRRAVRNTWQCGPFRRNESSSYGVLLPTVGFLNRFETIFPVI